VRVSTTTTGICASRAALAADAIVPDVRESRWIEMTLSAPLDAARW
jgi:hypothetical protein